MCTTVSSDLHIIIKGDSLNTDWNFIPVDVVLYTPQNIGCWEYTGVTMIVFAVLQWKFVSGATTVAENAMKLDLMIQLPCFVDVKDMHVVSLSDIWSITDTFT